MAKFSSSAAINEMDIGAPGGCGWCDRNMRPLGPPAMLGAIVAIHGDPAMPFTLALFATVALAGAPAAHPSRPTQVIPTHFQAGHFFATPETADGQALRLVVDTGGGGAAGLYWLTGASAERLHLKETTCALGEERLSVAKLPAFKPGRGDRKSVV